MKVIKPNSAAKPYGRWTAALLAVVLLLLFWRSFMPGYVHFSNDGPLAQQKAAWLQLPAAITGMWGDLNNIGNGAGSCAPDFSTLIRWALGPVGYAKFLVPLALFILGFSAWVFFRQLRLTPFAATVGALAAMLNATFLSTACWGVAGQQIAIGMDFLALALIVSNSPETPPLTRWLRLAIAGLTVGMSVTEGADNGALFSMLIAAFALFQSLVEDGHPVTRLSRGVGRVTVIALFAGFMAVQTVVSLVGSQIQGIVGTEQDTETKAAHWDWATQWSLPKKETFGLFVPGLFGYRMDTPDGGNYWGAGGRDAAWDRYFAGGRVGPPPDANLHFIRHTGGGNYQGILVTVIAVWAIAQALRRRDSVFSPTQRRYLWFWAVAVVLSLLVAYGRFAPFYQFLYMLPYFSTIRNPSKFLAIFSFALVVLFAYGVHGLSRRYLEVAAANSTSSLSQLQSWWRKVRGFDRHWTFACVAVVFASLLAWFVYAMQEANLVKYLQTVLFGKDAAKDIAAFSIRQVGWYMLFLVLTVGLLSFILSGAFAGRRARWAGIFLGVLVVADLGRASLPWVKYWNYEEKYASNPIIDFLRDKPYEHRVVYVPIPPRVQLPLYDNYYDGVYRIEWIQQLFPYYNIQSLDIVMLPRMPADMLAYTEALSPRDTPDTVYLIARRWALTNTRYLLSAAGMVDALNEQLDPAQHRFRILERFDLTPKPGIERPSDYEELTAEPRDNGSLALIEFTGALPRAKLYSRWQVSTNDSATLKTLASSDFDPASTVLVSEPLPPTASPGTNSNSGTVEYSGYATKDLQFHTQAQTPSVLLLNDKFDPDWRVWVDGKPAPLLRCNFIMRGVFLPGGAHTVEFQYRVPIGPLYVTVSAVAVALLLCGCLFLVTRRASLPAPSRGPAGL